MFCPPKFYTVIVQYCIVGKFGGIDVWQKWMDEDFGIEKFDG